MYEVEVPQLKLTSKMDLTASNGKGAVKLDWSNYDINNKYFVIYRKQEGEEQWKTIIGLQDKFNKCLYIDNLANDKVKPEISNINIIGNLDKNSMDVFVNSEDSGNKYIYYVEAYDMNDVSLLLSVSNDVEI
ncbi:MAG: hypothetical protein HFJ25_02330 [Clostridia bacterium]|nr:hypothetical protein [Clostridia bacterium]